MNEMIRLAASVVSKTGVLRYTNTDNFYMDGKFLHLKEKDNINISVGNSADDFLFSVNEGMENKTGDDKSTISISDELKKIHEKIKSGESDITFKFSQLCDSVVEIGNLIFSLSPGSEEEKLKKTAFTGLLISGNNAAVLNIGNTRAYFLRDNELRQLAADSKKAERLLKMGIITDEQAEALTNSSNKVDHKYDSGNSEISKSEIFNIKKDDIFILGSKGLFDSVDEERINEISDINNSTDEIAGLLVEEAIENGAKDNITALVIKIEKTVLDSEVNVEAIPVKKKVSNKYVPKLDTIPEDNETDYKVGAKKWLSTVVVCIGIGIMVFAAYKLWDNSNKSAQEDTDSQPSTGITSNIAENTNPAGQVATPTGAVKASPATTAVKPASSGGNASGSTTAPVSNVKYTVKAGDNLIKISTKFYNDPNKYQVIMEANGITNADKIMEGQVLIIPNLK
jgi:PPM family protein phosphatase